MSGNRALAFRLRPSAVRDLGDLQEKLQVAHPRKVSQAATIEFALASTLRMLARKLLKPTLPDRPRMPRIKNSIHVSAAP